MTTNKEFPASIMDRCKKFFGAAIDRTYHVEGHEFPKDYLSGCHNCWVITCGPIRVSKMRTIKSAFPTASLMLYYAKCSDKVVMFDEESYLQVYAKDRGYGYLEDKIHNATMHGSEGRYFLKDLMCVNDCGNIEMVTIPAFTKLQLFRTNIPHVYYAECYTDAVAGRISQVPELTSKATLISDDTIYHMCEPLLTGIYEIYNEHLEIHGPGINIRWPLGGYTPSELNRLEWSYEKITIRLIAIFRYAMPEAVRAFVPGIKNVLNDFLEMRLYLTNAEVDYAEKMLSGFLQEVYQAILEMEGLKPIVCRTTTNFILEKLSVLLDDEEIRMKNARHAHKLLSDFRENVEIRKDLLRQFNSVPTIGGEITNENTK